MAAAGEILARDARSAARRKIRPGVSTAELDDARRALHPLAAAAMPTFKGYRGFPGSICASPNSMIVHGIPGRQRLEGAATSSRSTSA